MPAAEVDLPEEQLVGDETPNAPYSVDDCDKEDDEMIDDDG